MHIGISIYLFTFYLLTAYLPIYLKLTYLIYLFFLLHFLAYSASLRDGHTRTQLSGGTKPADTAGYI